MTTQGSGMAKSFKQACLDYHKDPKPGKIATVITKPTNTLEDLSMGYSPGVGYPVDAISNTPSDVYKYTNKGNLVGVISNGTAVLGMGNVGALASKPVMEGKGVLFKKMADLDVFDIEINEENPDKLIDIIVAISPTFGAINLEDIRAPDCFYIESELRKRLNIPIIHDDQHGTAIVVAAGLLNALIVKDIDIHKAKIVLLGAGAAGIAVANTILNLGASPDLFYLADRSGVIHEERDLPDFKKPFAKKDLISLEEAMTDADVFIGLAAPKALPEHYLDLMSNEAIVFALSNPTPEASPEAVKRHLPNALYATGRSDLPNQINNVLAFPFMFKAALKLKIPQITPQMIANCATSLAALVHKPTLTSIIPDAFDKRLPEAFEKAMKASINDHE
jgi:malate dehydrogenase (oxaloacetate-decarboxylating)(NADP+)